MRFSVVGTDLGFSFEYDGKVFFLFGDTLGRQKFKGADSIAFSSDPNPEDCLALEFVAGLDNNFLSPTLPGISLGGYIVPSGGLSTNAKICVFLTTEHTGQKLVGRLALPTPSTLPWNQKNSTTSWLIVSPSPRCWEIGISIEADPRSSSHRCGDNAP